MMAGAPAGGHGPNGMDVINGMDRSASPATARTSATTARAVAFVTEHKPAAEALGTRLAELVNDPDGFTTELQAGFRSLADPEYVAGQQSVAPGIGSVHGVRWPLSAAVARAFRKATRHDRPTSLLYLADRLYREPHLEIRWFAFGLLERTLAAEPERSWQLLRRGAREAGDWITVDSLAHPYGRGILAESYRWAEIEQLTFSPSHWERRLVASTIATLPFVDRRSGREPQVATRALEILTQLIGDADADVQKALAWAYRSMTLVDPQATAEAVSVEAERAAATDDGHRAWVVRYVLPKLDPDLAARLKTRLAGIRKRAGAPATSAAAETAARFGELPDPTTHPEPPLA
jgi:3-methyladenine DNA glycosylase AlkD